MSEVKQMLIMIGIVLLMLPLILFLCFGDVNWEGRMRIISVESILHTAEYFYTERGVGTLEALKMVWTQNEGEFDVLVGFESVLLPNGEIVHLAAKPRLETFKFDCTPMELFEGRWSILDTLNPLNMMVGAAQRIMITIMLPVHALVAPIYELPLVLVDMYRPIEEVLDIPADGIWGDDLPADLIPPFGGVEID